MCVCVFKIILKILLVVQCMIAAIGRFSEMCTVKSQYCIMHLTFANSPVC